MRALSIAATGMSAQQLNVEVIANNIANTNTTGFKRSAAQFADLLYQTERAVGAPNRSGGEPIPEGISIGLGVQPVAIRSVNIQGPISNTGNQLDLALNGRGWFQVSGPNNTILYTRSGSFGKNAAGQLVTQDGSLIIPNITLPANTTTIQINPDGTVYYDTGTGTLSQAGQITIANFANEAGLQALGGNLYQETTVFRKCSGRCCRHRRLCHDPTGLSRKLKCRPSPRDNEFDIGPAKLRNELENHPSCGRDVPDDHQK